MFVISPRIARVIAAEGLTKKDVRQYFFEHCKLPASAVKGTTTHEIARRAGCSVALIHRNFEDKRGLLTAVIKERMPARERLFVTQLEPKDTALEDIIQALFRLFDSMKGQEDILRVTLGQMIQDPQVGRFVGQMQDRQVDTYEQILHRHAASRELRSDSKIKAVAHALTGMGFYFAFLGQVVWERDREQLRTWLRESVEELCKGIVNPRAGNHDLPLSRH